MPKTLDFQSFGEELWRIANVFRDDTLKTTEYLEEFETVAKLQSMITPFRGVVDGG